MCEKLSSQETTRARYIYCFRGDILDSEHVWFHVGTRNLSDEQIVDLMREEAPLALVPKMLDYFPRHRWIGAQAVIRQCIILSCTHDIMKEATSLWLPAIAKKNRGRSVEKAPEGLEPIADASAQGFVSEDEDASVGNIIVQAAIGKVAPDLQNCEAALDVKEYIDFKSRMKIDAFLWSQSAPQHRLVIMGVTFAPMDRYVRALTHLFSESWQRDNDIRSALGHPRKYRILETFHHGLENVCASEMLEVLTLASSWRALPFDACTLRNRSLAFRILSRRASGLYLLTYLPQSMCPHRLFQLLEDDPASDEDVRNIRPCEHTDFTKNHCDCYPGEQLFSPASRASLACIAEDAMEATNRIECGNAFWQREVRLKSTQVIQEHFSTCNATYMFMRQRRYEAKLVKMKRRSEVPKQRRRKVAQRRRKPRETTSLRKKPASAKGKAKWQRTKARAPVGMPRVTTYSEFASDYLSNKRKFSFIGEDMSKAFQAMKKTPRIKVYQQRCAAKKRLFEEEFRALLDAEGAGPAIELGTAGAREEDTQEPFAIVPLMDSEHMSVVAVHDPLGLEQDKNQLLGASFAAEQELATSAQWMLHQSRDFDMKLSQQLSQARSVVRRISSSSGKLEDQRSEQLLAWRERQEQANHSHVHALVDGRQQIVPSHPSVLRGEYVTPAIAMSRHVAVCMGEPHWGRRPLTSTTAQDAVGQSSRGVLSSDADPVESASTLHGELRADFERRCLTYRHANEKLLGAIKPSPLTASACRNLACCLHGLERQALKLFRLFFLSIVQKAYKKQVGNRLKPMFEDARGVLLLEFYAADADMDDVWSEAPSSSYWYHLGWTNQNTWSMALLSLYPDTNLSHVRNARSYGNVALRAAPDDLLERAGLEIFAKFGIENCPRAFLEYKLEHRCAYSIYEIIDEPRQLDDFIPADLEVKKVTDSVMFWPGAAKAIESCRVLRERESRPRADASGGHGEPPDRPLGPPLVPPEPLLDGGLEEVIGVEGSLDGGDGDPGVDEGHPDWLARLHAAMDVLPPGPGDDENEDDASRCERKDSATHGSDSDDTPEAMPPCVTRGFDMIRFFRGVYSMYAYVVLTCIA
jgi:hypothetical protein